MKRIVLLSGGIDSTVATSIAKLEEKEIPFYLMSRFYGHKREEVASRRVSSLINPRGHIIIPQREVIITEIMNYDRAIIDNIETVSYWGGDGKNALAREAGYILLRNLKEEENGEVILGINADDLAIRKIHKDSIDRIRESITSIDKRLHLSTPLIKYSKKQVMEIGYKLQSPIHLSWSCYRNSEIPCGKCEACDLNRHASRQSRIRL